MVMNVRMGVEVRLCWWSKVMSGFGGHSNMMVRRLGGRHSIVVGMRWVGTRMRVGGAFVTRAPSSSSMIVLLKTTLRYNEHLYVHT